MLLKDTKELQLELRQAIKQPNVKMKLNEDGSPYLHPITGFPMSEYDYEVLAVAHGWNGNKRAGKLRRVVLFISRTNWLGRTKGDEVAILLREGDISKELKPSFVETSLGEVPKNITIIEDRYI